jgi:hypothetical protein
MENKMSEEKVAVLQESILQMQTNLIAQNTKIDNLANSVQQLLKYIQQVDSGAAQRLTALETAAGIVVNNGATQPPATPPNGAGASN